MAFASFPLPRKRIEDFRLEESIIRHKFTWMLIFIYLIIHNLNMEKSMLLETIGDSVENRILDFLIEGHGLDYSKKDIAEGCEISRPTVYKVLPRMIEVGFIKASRKVGRITLYSINPDNERIKALLRLEELLLKESFSDAEKSAASSTAPSSIS